MITTLIILGVLAIIGGAIAVSRLSHSGGNQTPLTTHDETDFPPKPKWKPIVPVDILRTVQTFAYYTDHKKSFAVFAHGTCVLLPDGSQDFEKDAKGILDKIYRYHPDFKPQGMDDGHFLVNYLQPVYSVVFKEEVEKHRTYIDQNYLNGIVRDEVLLNDEGKSKISDDRLKIGLFGRARMFLDAQNPVVVQVWHPQP